MADIVKLEMEKPMGVLTRRAILGLGVILGVLCATAAAQVPGPVVNIVSNDPFNQKQVEVDAAANPLNPGHIFAGFIDYQTVGSTNDPGPSEPGPIFSKAWCGYSFSTNNGKTWKSALVPGFPGNTGTELPGGGNSPILGSTQCGDPVVAWDTSGHVFYLGVAQGHPTLSTIFFVARFTDLDDGKGTLRYDFTTVIDTGNPSSVGQDLDKPSLLFVPDATPGSSPAAGTLFACGTIFDGQKDNKFRNKVVCALASTTGGDTTNFGKTFSRANQGKVNGNVNTNNGTAIAPILDGNGGVYVFWRAFLGTENGYWFVKLDKFGNATTPAPAVGVWNPPFFPYDADSLDQLARSHGFPTVGTDASGRILLAFQAYSDPTGYMAAPSSINTPRIFLTYSTSGGGTWSVPRAVDYGPFYSNASYGYAFQFMPRLAVGGGGAFQILYYDSRNDGRPITDINNGAYFLPYGRDRRFDVRLVQGQFDSAGNVSFNLPSVQVSQYRRSDLKATFGKIVDRPGSAGCVAHYGTPNPDFVGNCPAVLLPNLPIAKGGHLPFIGDYIALAPAVPLVRNKPGPSLPAWRFANQPGDPQTYLAFFVSTQDIGFPLNSSNVPAINGDWTQFVPAVPVGFPSTSCINPRTRDANIYFSAISPGIVASWSGTSKTLKMGTVTIPPVFTVTVKNRSGRRDPLTVRLTIRDAAPVTRSDCPNETKYTEDWSFVQTPPAPAPVPCDQNTVDIQILRNSNISLPVYYRFRSSLSSSPSAPVSVTVEEIDQIGGNVKIGGLQTSVSYSLAIDDLAIDDLAIDDLAIDDLAIDDLAIDDRLVPDHTVTWSVRGGNGSSSMPTPGNSITNVANGQQLLDAGYWFQLLFYQTQNNPDVNGCATVLRPTAVVLSYFTINNLQQNSQVSNSTQQVHPLEIQNSAIRDPQASNATFVADPNDHVKIKLRSFRPPTLPPSTPPFTPTPQTLGQATFSQAANPDGTRATSFLDETPPVITANCFVPPESLTATPCKTSGWYNSAVKVTWSVSDLQSGIVSSQLFVNEQPEPTPGCFSKTFATDTNGTTLKCTATNGKGLSYTPPALTIKIDTTPPTVIASATTADGNPYAAGTWTNQTVTVSFSGTDDLSGVSNCTASVPLSNEGGNQSASGTCTDNAGNTSSAVSFGPVNIDTTAPTISGSRPPLANSNGWNNTDVTVSFTCLDSLSGLAAGSPPAATTLSSEGAGQSVTGTCTDKAGNSASAAVSGINIDKTAPEINGSRTPLANSNGWNNTDVTVSFTGTDSLSGVDSCSGPVTRSTEGANQSALGTCTDKAGNSASATVSGINIDKTKPTITNTVPANNASYLLNATVLASCTCSDSLSGIGTVNIGSPFNTARVDKNTFTFTATDKAGNSDTLEVTYYVVYNFALTQPKSPARLGSAVPLSWKLTDGSAPPQVISDMTSLVALWSVFNGPVPPLGCTASLTLYGTAPIKTLYAYPNGATGKSDFRFNTTTNSFQFNWDTTTVGSAVGCYTVVFQLKDNLGVSPPSFTGLYAIRKAVVQLK